MVFTANIVSQRPAYSYWQHVVLPLGQMHGGDDQSNADVVKVMWVGNRTYLNRSCKGCSLL